jgi:hypothetical protein
MIKVAAGSAAEAAQIAQSTGPDQERAQIDGSRGRVR